jgi:gamma-glutamyltranspeptidase/glutathione hydrolase
VDIATATAAPRWFVEPEEHFAPPVEVRLESRFPPPVRDGLAARGHPVTELGAFEGLLGHCHAIELVGGGPAAPGGSLAAATDPRSAGLPAVR